jgi:hypothetical protein
MFLVRVHTRTRQATELEASRDLLHGTLSGQLHKNSEKEQGVTKKIKKIIFILLTWDTLAGICFQHDCQHS